MKIDWEGKSITIGKGTTTIEAVGSMINIETDGEVTINGDVSAVDGYGSVEEMLDRLSEMEPVEECWSPRATYIKGCGRDHGHPMQVRATALALLALPDVRAVAASVSTQARLAFDIAGGDIYKIADTIYDHKPCGVLLVGSVAVDIPTEYGCTNTARFNYSH